MENLIAAVIQLTSTEDVARNLTRAAELCARARERGARLCLLPENFALLSSSEADRLGAAEALDGDGPILRAMRDCARRLGLHLILGGMPERSPVPGQIYNTCVALGPDGETIAVYRKIHLFDVDLGATDRTVYRESALVTPGDAGQAVVAPTPWGGVGLSVCYDVRFPELYRRLGAAGARLLVVPAAFTLHTGKDHWHVLLRARAIENQCFVLAAAQQGRHGATRQTYGHSLIADPWGTVLSECPDGEGVAVAELDFARQDQIRRELPCLGHRRL
jgi:predicted amidohydrolase